LTSTSLNSSGAFVESVWPEFSPHGEDAKTKDWEHEIAPELAKNIAGRVGLGAVGDFVSIGLKKQLDPNYVQSKSKKKSAVKGFLCVDQVHSLARGAFFSKPSALGMLVPLNRKLGAINDSVEQVSLYSSLFQKCGSELLPVANKLSSELALYR